MLLLVKKPILHAGSLLSNFWEPQKFGMQEQEFSPDHANSEVLTMDMDRMIASQSPYLIKMKMWSTKCSRISTLDYKSPTHMIDSLQKLNMTAQKSIYLAQTFSFTVLASTFRSKKWFSKALWSPPGINLHCKPCAYDLSIISF